VLDSFLAPTFADSALYERDPSGGLIAFGLVLGAAVGLAGIGIAYFIWVKNPQIASTAQRRLAPLHALFVNKWYFDEIIDLLVVRPMQWFGAWAQQTFERVVVNGLLVGGTTGVVRAGSSAVRAAQTGFLRYYTLLIVVGTVVVTFYFLMNS
jgi:NADH-quinone oxidoreductase subunit L